MRKENPARFSSAVGESWMHCEFKIKYCHKIFDDEIYREGLMQLLLEAANDAEMPIGEIGFADDHVHFMADICNYSRPQVAKILRGYTGKKFFEFFPEAKDNFFWKSGLWNPSYYIGSPRNLTSTINYIKKQKYGGKGIGKSETTLFLFGG